MLRFLGELDCFEDLAWIVGRKKAEESWSGKLNYFQDGDDVFGCSDFVADMYFDMMAEEEMEE